jgi:DNA invertase Pin-like site-specific DNA recombinase
MGEILGYARASSGDQDIAGQTARLTQAGATNVFCDIGSDPSLGRPGLEGLLATARTGDALAGVGLDRLGRTINELLATVATLKQRGIALVCLDEQIDTRSTDGGLILHLFGAIARCERRLAVE